jgi:hypothetical protein
MARKIAVVVKDRKDPLDERRYWASKTPKERVEAVTRLRLQCFAMMGLDELPRLARKVGVRARHDA